jgi:hypothetical protein
MANVSGTNNHGVGGFETFRFDEDGISWAFAMAQVIEKIRTKTFIAIVVDLILFVIFLFISFIYYTLFLSACK